MLLSARMLNDVADVNHFRYATQVEAMQGCDFDVYFQLTDASVERYLNPRGRRYMPLAGATLNVTIQPIDSSQAITRAAQMAFPDDDRSIFVLHIAAADALVGSFGLTLSLSEQVSAELTKVQAGWVDQAVSIQPQNPSF